MTQPLSLTLELPRGSSRPPLLMIRLWDDDVHDEDEALASNDIRLVQGGGLHDVTLTGRGRDADVTRTGP